MFEKDTLSYPGAIVGFGYGNGYADGPLGIKFFNSFLSTGLRDAEEREKYEAVANSNPENVRGKYLGGVRIFNTLDIAKDIWKIRYQSMILMNDTLSSNLWKMWGETRKLKM